MDIISVIFSLAIFLFLVYFAFLFFKTMTAKATKINKFTQGYVLFATDETVQKGLQNNDIGTSKYDDEGSIEVTPSTLIYNGNKTKIDVSKANILKIMPIKPKFNFFKTFLYLSGIILVVSIGIFYFFGILPSILLGFILLATALGMTAITRTGVLWVLVEYKDGDTHKKAYFADKVGVNLKDVYRWNPEVMGINGGTQSLYSSITGIIS